MKSDREVTIRIVRKKRAHKGHHGGAWKVAFADFMTSMMALFLVLWLITQSSEVRSAIAGYFQDPLGRANEFGTSVIPGQGQSSLVAARPDVQIQPADGKRNAMLDLSQRVKDELAKNADLKGLSGHVAIEVTPDGLRISLLEDSSDVFFASGSARPLPRAEALIRAIGTVLGSAAYPIVVEGHTDAHKYPNDSTYGNWELSADRANAARRLLREGGVADPQVLAVRGLADRDPRIIDDPKDPRNRRVTILVSTPATPVTADSVQPKMGPIRIGDHANTAVRPPAPPTVP
ncbi:MAG TPA: flagellar motor protein MotB [Gemmatimonadales bacterium]